MGQELTVPLSTPVSASPQMLAEIIAAGGAILTLAGCPVRRYLVGHLAWVDPRRLFWFTAHGDTAEDGHVLDFDEIQAVTNQWICFYRAGTLVGTLSSIGTSGVDDPDDYLIAWQLWHEVEPRRTSLITRCLAGLSEDGDIAEPAIRPNRPAFPGVKPDPR